MTNEFGFEDRADPSVGVEKTGFDPFPQGDVQVLRIAKWIKKDDLGPIFFVSKSGDLKCMFEFEIPQSEKDRLSALTGKKIERGPVMSATRTQMVALLHAFGFDISNLPNEASTAFLLAVAAQLVNNTQPRVAHVNKDGWVQYVQGANPPEAPYQWRYAGSRSPSGTTPVRFEERDLPGKNGSKYPANILYMYFEIVGDDWGNPSPFNGYTMEIRVSNPFDVPTATRPQYLLGAKGGTPVVVDRFKKFVSIFCKGIESHRWERDVEKSSYGVDELSNPMPVIDGFAKKAGVIAKNYLKFSDGGMPKLDFETFYAKPETLDRDAQQAKAMQQSSALEELYTLVEDTLTPDFRVFESTPKDSDELNLKMTTQGKNWAKEVLVPAWSALNLPMSGNLRLIGKLNDDDLKALTAYLAPASEDSVPFDVDSEEEGF